MAKSTNLVVHDVSVSPFLLGWESSLKDDLDTSRLLCFRHSFLVNVYRKLWKIHPFLMGKSTIIDHLPSGKPKGLLLKHIEAMAQSK